MAQQKPDNKTSLDQVLKLIDQLTPEEQEQLVEEVKLQWLRREVGKAEESLDRGEGRPADQVFNELKERYERRKSTQ